MMKTINVSEETWETLAIMRIKGKFANCDELIKHLIINQKEQS